MKQIEHALREKIGLDAASIGSSVIQRNVRLRTKRGVYRQNSFRGSDLGFRSRHFRRTREGFALSPAVCASVLFQQGNLLSEEFRPPAGQYDYIFCRNLLIYFDRLTQQRALAR